MKKILSIITILFLGCFLHVNICHALTSTISSSTGVVYCGDDAYLNIAKDTFKNATRVTCEIAKPEEIELLSLKNNIGKVYKITLTDEASGQDLNFARQEIPLMIPKKILNNISEDSFMNIKGYVYDENIHDWVSTNGNDQGNIIETKIMKSGYVTLLEKQSTSYIFDKYSFFAFITLCIGIIFVIIKVK